MKNIAFSMLFVAAPLAAAAQDFAQSGDSFNKEINFIIIIIAAIIAFGIGIIVGRFTSRHRKSAMSEPMPHDYVQRGYYDELKAQHKQTMEELQTKVAQAARLQQANSDLEVRNKEILAEQELKQKQLQSEFENLANRILDEKSKKFVTINEEKIAGILNPLKERIQTFEKKVEETYSNEVREKTSLRTELKLMMEQSQKMSADANNLTQALKGSSKTQGDWGEVQLEVLLENSGLQRNIHYQKQVSIRTEEGKDLRPDYIVNLPEKKHYVIDCKVSLIAYERYFNAATDAQREAALREHLQSIQRHISDLSAKNYQSLYGINSPDFVFLFVPIEPALTAALQADNELYNKAIKKNIVLLSQSTLLATLRMCAFLWHRADQQKYAEEIARHGGALYDKFVGFLEDLTAIGIRIDAAQKSYEEAMNKLSTSQRKGDTIIGRVQKLKELGANTNKNIDQKLLDKTL
jgi:DNA recombination protein RmuC